MFRQHWAMSCCHTKCDRTDQRNVQIKDFTAMTTLEGFCNTWQMNFRYPNLKGSCLNPNIMMSRPSSPLINYDLPTNSPTSITVSKQKQHSINIIIQIYKSKYLSFYHKILSFYSHVQKSDNFTLQYTQYLIIRTPD